MRAAMDETLLQHSGRIAANLAAAQAAVDAAFAETRLPAPNVRNAAEACDRAECGNG
jgi:hypothetical protein